MSQFLICVSNWSVFITCWEVTLDLSDILSVVISEMSSFQVLWNGLVGQKDFDPSYFNDVSFRANERFSMTELADFPTGVWMWLPHT